MQATVIPGCDERPIGAPEDWVPDRHGHCGGLFVRREEVSGLQFMRSAWEADSTEAMMLFAGARIHLGVQGTVHPVVNLGVYDLPPDFEPTVNAQRYNAADGRSMVRVDMLFPHGGGRRAYSRVHVDGTLADAVSTGIIHCEALARERGWIA